MGNRLGSAPPSAAWFFISSRPAPPLLPHLGEASSSIPALMWVKQAELILHNYLTNISSSLPENLGLKNQNMQLCKTVGPGKKESQNAAGTSKKADHKNSTVQKSVYWELLPENCYHFISKSGGKGNKSFLSSCSEIWSLCQHWSLSWLLSSWSSAIMLSIAVTSSAISLWTSLLVTSMKSCCTTKRNTCKYFINKYL